MKETTLESLIKLFAIIANVNEGQISSGAEKVIEEVLERAVRRDKMNYYLDLFKKYLQKYHKVNISDDINAANRKKRSSQSVKALVVCERSNEVLQQHEKIRIISRLIEFTNEDGILTENENEFIVTVKDAFHISNKEYTDIRSMILSPWIQGVSKDKLILIDKNEMDTPGREKHLQWRGIEGQIIAIYIESSKIFMFKYLGDDILYRNAQAIFPNVIEFLDTGSFIRGSKITPIYFSTLSARFFQDTITSNLEYVAEGIEYKFRNSENGVQEFSFAARAGDLVGIMGGSGVGKSTLLDLFNGNLVPQKGNIFINGFDLNKNKEKLEGIIGYIPQDDLLMEDLTVFQNLYYNAKLCFSDYTEIKILKTVIRLLKELDLYNIRYLKVGNPLEKYISGGQRKRLNIGLELLREPMIMFIDEPTSGLSSMDAEMVMLLLKRQTLRGKIVLINIHQPSSDIFKLFNRILILDKGGYIVYQGDPLDALVYFKTENQQLNADESQCTTCGNVNPEQILDIVETKYVNEFGRLTDIRRFSPIEWYEKYNKGIENKNKQQINRKNLPQINFKVPGHWKQFLVFGARDIRSKIVNKQYMFITFLEAPVLAIIIGYFTKYYSGSSTDPGQYVFINNDNLVSYIFMSVIVSLFLGMILSAEEIIKDARILKRESFLHLSSFSYINSKVFIVFTISAIQMITFVVIGNYMLEIKGMTLKYWLMLFSAACLANMIGLNISAALKSVATIYIVIPLILVPQILFSGTVVPFDKLRTLNKHSRYVPVAGDIMTSRWAFEALTVEQFKNNRFERNFFEDEMRMSRAMFKTSFLIPLLKGKMDEARKILNSGKDNEVAAHNLHVVYNEINDLAKETGIHPGQVIWMLTGDRFSQEVNLRIQEYLDSLSIIYNIRNNAASREKDRIYSELEKQLGSKNALLEMQNNYTNQSITNLALNRNQLYKIIDFQDHLIQRMDPVFKIPDSKIGRAHMYAPVKRIGNIEIDTYWFNLTVIWFTTILAYLVLYNDSLRRLVAALEAFQIRRIDRTRKRVQIKRTIRKPL